MVKKKQKIVLPPELPEIEDADIEVSDEDVKFVNQNRDYATLVSSMDTESITKHVKRVADAKEDDLEAAYEKRSRKKLLERGNEQDKLQVDRVDALPTKTLDGKLHYKIVPVKEVDNNPNEREVDEDDCLDKSLVKLTKSERRKKLKKSKREAKIQTEEVGNSDEVEQTPQAEVLAEVRKDISALEKNENKKHRLAELGMALLADPEANIKSLKELLQIFTHNDHVIVKLGMLSLLAVFKDIIPGYRIRLPTEKELEMTVSKDVKKMRYYESTLLSSYKAYLQKLITFERQHAFKQVTIRCLCTLLDAVPFFNFRDSLLGIVVRNISSSDDVTRELCCSTIKSLFTNEGKHGGEATVEAVRLIAAHVKTHNCQLHPDSIEVFLSLSFNEDLGKPATSKGDKKFKSKKGYRRFNSKEPIESKGDDKKKKKQEMKAKLREEVDADFKAAAFIPDVMEQKRMQSDTLSAVFQTYFRILKHTMQLISGSSEAVDKSAGVRGPTGAHPLLDPCLNGLGKFSHLIDVDFMSSLMNYLKKLASCGSNPCDPLDNSSKSLSVSERLRCCIVAFRVMKNNLDALNVDLQDFFVQLYNLILEYRPGRDKGEVLAEALKIMLCDERQHDMQKAAAFIKRLATFSLFFGSAESMAALVTLKHLLLKNIKCRNLLENDAGGGSVSGSVAIYHPYASDPNLSGALASVLWELTLLTKHYHPSVSAVASSITTMNTANQVYLTILSPQQAYADASLERSSLLPKNDNKKLNLKRKRSGTSATVIADSCATILNDDGIRKKFSDHFMVLRDIQENKRLRNELDRTTLSLQLYEEYKSQKRSKKDGSKQREVK